MNCDNCGLDHPTHWCFLRSTNLGKLESFTDHIFNKYNPSHYSQNYCFHDALGWRGDSYWTWQWLFRMSSFADRYQLSWKPKPR